MTASMSLDEHWASYYKSLSDEALLSAIQGGLIDEALLVAINELEARGLELPKVSSAQTHHQTPKERVVGVFNGTAELKNAMASGFLLFVLVVALLVVSGVLERDASSVAHRISYTLIGATYLAAGYGIWKCRKNSDSKVLRAIADRVSVWGVIGGLILVWLSIGGGN
ncbi:MAG: hypothetical protein JNM32_06990 [Dechloromonas sp.]|nr:hypothetical protein [Dechloromonas sp.]